MGFPNYEQGWATMQQKYGTLCFQYAVKCLLDATFTLYKCVVIRNSTNNNRYRNI